jgi:hypothetical protein
MRGESKRWRPRDYLQSRYPEVQVHDYDLPDRLQGCVDHEKRIIWLDRSLTYAEWRSTLAYEVGRLQLGPTPDDACLAAAHQRDAAEWAARMLIDSEDLVDAFARASCHSEVAALLEVDLPTVRARLRGMTDGEQDEVYAAIQRQRLSA